MKLTLHNTAHGLIPVYDSDFEEKRKLKIGETYYCEINRPRNYEFHKKFFALIRMAHHNLPESLQELYPTEEKLRKALQVMAGFCEVYYTIEGQEVISPVSISFSNMDNDEFQRLYDGVLKVLFKHVFIGSTYENIEAELMSFM
jgi:hypothetical protein